VRVQNSVFECVLDAAQLKKLEIDLEQLIDPAVDSLRFYRLGNNYKTKVKHIGAKQSLDVEGPLIF
jgi:CRISPR-associated protein Cas2